MFFSLDEVTINGEDLLLVHEGGQPVLTGNGNIVFVAPGMLGNT